MEQDSASFWGQRDRSFFIVPGQRDNRTSSKSCHRTGRASIAYKKTGTGHGTGRDNHYFSVKIRDRTGRDSQTPGRDTGQNGTEQKKDVLKQKRMF